MNNTERHCRQDGKAPILAETFSCTSSSTLVESIFSTQNLPLDPEESRRSLSQLPTHLLPAITAYLDVVSKICLQSVNRHFRKVVDVDRANLGTCARYLLNSRFALHDVDLEKTLPASCTLCKISPRKKRYSADHVRYLNEPRLGNTKWILRALDRIPWVRPYTTLELNKRYLYRHNKWRRPNCYAHIMEQFAPHPEVEALLPFVKPRDKPTWLAFTVLWCMHCGKCISEGDTRLEGCLDCMCDFCFRAPGFVFRRWGPGQSDQARPKQMFKDPVNGMFYVVEGSGKERRLVPVLLPVSRADGTLLLISRIYFVNEARALRPGHSMGATQQRITSHLDSYVRLEAEILRLPRKSDK